MKAFNRAAYIARPNCIYCGKPIDGGAWDDESQGWFSYGSMCMFDHKDGRYAVQQTNPEGTKTVRRFATLKRAQDVAVRMARDNAPCVWANGWTWAAVDLGEGLVVECQPD